MKGPKFSMYKGGGSA